MFVALLVWPAIPADHAATWIGSTFSALAVDYAIGDAFTVTGAETIPRTISAVHLADRIRATDTVSTIDYTITYAFPGYRALLAR